MKKLILAAVMAASFAGAQASVITQTFTSGTKLTDFTSTFTYNLFAASLGTLDSVTASWAWNTDSSATLKNNGNSAQTFKWTANYEFDLTGNGFADTATGILLSVPTTTLASGATLPVAAVNKNSGATPTAVAIANKAAFIGTGQDSLTCGTLNGSTFAGGGGNVAAQQTTTGSCSFTLVYNYTAAVTPPAGVPEPTSLALVGLALAGAGLVSRRRQA